MWPRSHKALGNRHSGAKFSSFKGFHPGTKQYLCSQIVQMIASPARRQQYSNPRTQVPLPTDSLLYRSSIAPLHCLHKSSFWSNLQSSCQLSQLFLANSRQLLSQLRTEAHERTIICIELCMSHPQKKRTH